MLKVKQRWVTDIRTASQCPSVWLLIFSVFVVGCSRTESPGVVYQRVWATFLSGEIARAAAQAGDQSFARRSDIAWHWRFRLLQAEALLAQAQVAKAADLLKDPVPNGLDNKQLEVRRLIDTADAWSKSRRRADALDLLDKVERDATDPDLRIRIDVLRGGILARVGRPDLAETVLNRACTLAAKQGNTYQEASALLNLSYTRKQRYQYGPAVEYGERALALADKIGARRVAAGAHENLGSCLTFLGDFDQALEHHQKAIDLFSAMQDRTNLMISLGELGLLHETSGQLDRAAKEFHQAFDVAQGLHNTADAARHADNLAQTYLQLGDLNKAEQWNNTALSVAPDDSSSRPFILLNAASIASGRGRPDEALRLFRAIVELPDVYPGLLWRAHEQMAHIYSQQHRDRDADREYRAALDEVDKTRSDLSKSEYKITFLSRLISLYRSYVDLLIDQRREIDALNVIESSRARVLTERLGRDISGARIRDFKQLEKLAATSDASLLSFWIAPKRSFAWLITASGVQKFTLPPANEIESAVVAYQRFIENSLRDPLASADPKGEKLWSMLLGEISPHIPKGTRVLVIPDGPLHQLNLETLPIHTGSPRYWIDDVQLAVAPSLTVATSNSGVSRPAPSLLAIGAPDYHGTPYQPLNNAASEIRELQARFVKLPRAVYTGGDARPIAYRNSDPARFSFIHFAAHAEANRERPLESAIILSRDQNDYKLYARDVVDIPIHADLVTLSACHSAGVRAYAGEGLIGFAWAFLHAGAKTVIAGLWAVDDQSTASLMSGLYSQLESGKDPIAAMHNAKLALLHGGQYPRKPYYWGPFQVYIGVR